MNVLLLARIIGKTGVGNHVKELSEELTAQGHHVVTAASANSLNIAGGGITG